jgi:2-octaprenyl-6-methoxyphenol hydroxylase
VSAVERGGEAPQRLVCDVLIVGGGLVGAVLANALARIPVATILVERDEARTRSGAGFDERVTALANGSQRVLAQLGLWPLVRSSAEAIRRIHVSERGRFGAVRIDAREEGVEALGYTVENSVLGRAFWQALESAQRFQRCAPAELLTFHADEEGIVAEAASRTGRVSIRAKLLIAADGARSPVRARLGIAAREDDYTQRALVVNCTTEEAAKGRAFERFAPAGPLAFLPLTGGRVSVVWTLDRAGAARAAALDEDAFRAELQRAFGYRLGRILRIGERTTHELRRVRSDALCARRVALIGSAAVTVHPVAGQGFNLALRDVAILAELIADAVRAGEDPGHRAVLEQYRAWRARDQRNVAWFTHGLIRCFGLTAPGAGTARGLGLLAFDIAPGAKALLAAQTMGKAGRLPRLARGLEL